MTERVPVTVRSSDRDRAGSRARRVVRDGRVATAVVAMAVADRRPSRSVVARATTPIRDDERRTGAPGPRRAADRPLTPPVPGQAKPCGQQPHQDDLEHNGRRVGRCRRLRARPGSSAARSVRDQAHAAMSARLIATPVPASRRERGWARRATREARPGRARPSRSQEQGRPAVPGGSTPPRGGSPRRRSRGWPRRSSRHARTARWVIALRRSCAGRERPADGRWCLEGDHDSVRLAGELRSGRRGGTVDRVERAGYWPNLSGMVVTMASERTSPVAHMWV